MFGNLWLIEEAITVFSYWQGKSDFHSVIYSFSKHLLSSSYVRSIWGRSIKQVYVLLAGCVKHKPDYNTQQRTSCAVGYASNIVSRFKGQRESFSPGRLGRALWKMSHVSMKEKWISTVETEKKDATVERERISKGTREDMAVRKSWSLLRTCYR